MRMPYVLNWSAGVQWEFSHNWLLETKYQGQAGIGLVNAWNMNAIPLNISTDPAVLTKIFQATQNYKPYPQFGTINAYSNYGHNTHHSGSLRVERRFTNGLALNAFYTYQKSLSECDGEGSLYRHHVLQPEFGESPNQFRYHPPLCQRPDLRVAVRQRTTLDEQGWILQPRARRLGIH